MRKIFMAICALCLALGAKAQSDLTVWYGANISNVSVEGGSADSEFKALNIGVSYTNQISEDFDWQVGAGYVTKGAKEWSPGFIQVEGNGAWNFVKKERVKVSLFTGPYVSMLIAKDDAEGTKSVGFGWQGGVGASISCISLKVGYEYGFTDLYDAGKSKPNNVFFRIGYNF